MNIFKEILYNYMYIYSAYICGLREIVYASKEAIRNTDDR